MQKFLRGWRQEGNCTAVLKPRGAIAHSFMLA